MQLADRKCDGEQKSPARHQHDGPGNKSPRSLSKTLRTKDAFTGSLSNRVRGGRGWVDHGGRGDARRPRGAKALGPEALARAMRHRRWRAVQARRSRPAVSDRREPGSAEKKREPKRVHRLIVPATRRVTGASGAPFSDSLLMHPDSPPEWVDDGLANPTRDPAQLAFPSPRGSRREVA